LRVGFEVPVDVAFTYLADPRNRPQWQSSLTRVELLTDGEPRVGTRWRDHTRPGLVPEMEITVLEPGRAWAETGRWRGFSAELTLGFEPAASGCMVEVTFRVRHPGLLAVIARLATLGALVPVRSDVRRAARILASRAH
jgi:hypothetical protein